MTLKEKIICTAYTGFNFCSGEDYCRFRQYADGLMGRPYQDIEMINEGYWEKLRALSRPDFDRMINGEFESEWIPVTERLPMAHELVLVSVEDRTSDMELIKYVTCARHLMTIDRWINGNSYLFDVVAWQPLPEPYQEVDNDRPGNIEE